MTSGLGSISLTGQALGMGGIGGSIDTDALIEALMNAKSIPQQRLKLALADQQALEATYQGLRAQFTSMRNAAWKVDDSDSWAVTTATSSHAAVVATSSLDATPGSATFRVTQLAAAQVSTVAADANGAVVDDFTQGLSLTVGGEAHTIDLTSGSAEDVASAINKAGLGVRAAVIVVDDPDTGPDATKKMLQLTASKTGTDASFGATGFGDGGGSAQQIVAASNAQISVGGVDEFGDPLPGSYTVSSQSNTFTGAMPGVTFSIGADAIGKDVTVTVAADANKVSDTVKAMVDAVNTAKSAIATHTGRDGLLQGRSEFRTLGFDMGSLIANGVAGGGSFADFGIDMNKDGVISFDADTFAAAYAADAKGAMDAISKLANGMASVADDAIAPVTGAVSGAIDASTVKQADIARDISTWSTRLDAQRVQLTLKYTAMQTALARLEGQSDWLTSMFKSLEAKDD